MKPLAWLFIIDLLKGLKPETDSTLALIREALAKGIECSICHVNDLSIDHVSQTMAFFIKFSKGKWSTSFPKSSLLDSFVLICLL